MMQDSKIKVECYGHINEHKCYVLIPLNLQDSIRQVSSSQFYIIKNKIPMAVCPSVLFLML